LVREYGDEYVDSLFLTLKLDWPTHAPRLDVDLKPPNLDLLMALHCKYFYLSSNDYYNLSTLEFCAHNYKGNCNEVSEQLDFKVPLDDSNGYKLSKDMNPDIASKIVTHENSENIKKFMKNLFTDKLFILQSELDVSLAYFCCNSIQIEVKILAKL
jgi:hypothetical protein